MNSSCIFAFGYVPSLCPRRTGPRGTLHDLQPLFVSVHNVGKPALPTIFKVDLFLTLV